MENNGSLKGRDTAYFPGINEAQCDPISAASLEIVNVCEVSYETQTIPDFRGSSIFLLSVKEKKKKPCKYQCFIHMVFHSIASRHL